MGAILQVLNSISISLSMPISLSKLIEHRTLKRGGKIVVVGCNDIVEQAFKRLGFDRIIEILKDESDVSKAFSI